MDYDETAIAMRRALDEVAAQVLADIWRDHPGVTVTSVNASAYPNDGGA